jgi:WD40 repeat protein
MSQGTEQQNSRFPAHRSNILSAPPPAEIAEPAQHKYEYDAFVSYRRRDATRLAQWIRNKLQRFRLPPEVLRELPHEKQELQTRGPRIWLDTSYEKSSDDFLLKKVFPALDQSARLIVVSTPAALENITGKDGKAQDNWLVREIDHFLGNVPADETNRPVDVVFGPGAIEGLYPGRLSEKPRWDWIDLRSFSMWRVRTFSETLDYGLTKLVAGLYDVPDRFIPLLRREERRRRHRAIILLGGTGFCIAALMTGLAIWGLIQRADAVSSLKSALVTRAQMSVRLATEELQKKDPENALATALAGVDTPSITDTDRAVIPDSITAVSNSMANLGFGGTLRDHSDAVLKVVLGAGRKRAITVGANEEAILWAGENGQPLRPIRSTMLAGNVFAVAQNSGLIASGSPSGQIYFWNSSAPELSPKPFEFGEPLLMLVFSDNGEQVAALGTAGKLAIWDVTKNSIIWAAPTPIPDASIVVLGPICSCLAVGTLTGDLFIGSFDRSDPVLVRGASGRVTNGRFGRDQQFIFTTDDGRLWLTSAPSWPPPLDIGDHGSSITGFAIAPDGRLAATTSIDGTARVWDLAKRLERNAYKAVADAAVSSVTFSPDANAFALAYGDGTVAVSDIGAAGADTSAKLVMRGHTGAVLDLSFSPDGNWLASASLDHTARFWQLQTARRPRMQHAHEGAALHAVSKDGAYLVSGGTDKKIQLWTGPIWEPENSIVLENQPSALAVSENGKRVFIGTDRGELLEWKTSGSVTKPFSHDNGVISAIAVSPDGKTLAAIGIDAKKLQLCSLVNSPPSCTAVSGLIGWGYSVAFSQDGHWMGATSGVEAETGLVLIRDLNTNTSKLLKGHTERVSSIQFDRSGNRAVSVSWDGTARIWDLSSSKELVRLVEPRGRMSTAGFSPDDEWVATTSYDKTLRLWNVPKTTDPNETVIMEAGHSILVSDTTNLGQLKFEPGGDILAASVENGGIHLWHVPDGTLRAVLESDGFPIQSMYFHPDGLQVTAMTHNGRLLSWNVTPALGLKDDLLLSAARSMLPLAGSLAGKLEEPSTSRSTRSGACAYLHERNLGLPPHHLSGAARARQRVRIPDSCRSNLTKKSLLAGLIAETEGDFVTASERFRTAISEGEFSGEIGLGDLSFVDSLIGPDAPNAIVHYTRAQAQGVAHAASRLGWLVLADRREDGAAQAKRYFEEASGEGDADGFAGLAWISERFGKFSAEDFEAAFSNYIKAQYAYERDGDPALAQDVAERRAMLAHLLPPKRVADLFLYTRKSITSSKGINQQ